MESAHAYATGQQTDDVAIEQAKLSNARCCYLAAPPLVVRCASHSEGLDGAGLRFGFGYGYKGGTNQYGYGEGALN